MVFASPPAPDGSSVLPAVGLPIQQQQPITLRTWDNKGGPISSWDVRIDTPFFELPHPPIAFPEPLYLVPDFDTFMRLSGQTGAMTANPVPEPESLPLLLFFAAARVALFAFRLGNQVNRIERKAHRARG